MGLENKIPRHSQYYIYLWQVFLDSIPIFLTVFLFLVGKTFIFSDDFPMIQDPKPAVYSLPPRLSTSIGKHDEDRSHVVTWPPNAQQMILDVSKWLIPSAWKSATEGGVYCSVILRVVCFHRFSKGPKTGQVAKLGLNRAQQRPNIELSLRCGRKHVAIYAQIGWRFPPPRPIVWAKSGERHASSISWADGIFHGGRKSVTIIGRFGWISMI